MTGIWPGAVIAHVISACFVLAVAAVLVSLPSNAVAQTDPNGPAPSALAPNQDSLQERLASRLAELEILANNPKTPTRVLVLGQYNVARLLRETGQPERAEELLSDATDLIRDTGKVDREIANGIYAELGQLLAERGVKTAAETMAGRIRDNGGLTPPPAVLYLLLRANIESQSQAAVSDLDLHAQAFSRAERLQNAHMVFENVEIEDGLLAALIEARLFLGDDHKFTLETATYYFQALINKRILSSTEIDHLFLFSRLAENKYSDQSALTQGLRYMLLQARKAAGQPAIIDEFNLSVLQLETTIRSALGPWTFFSARAPASAALLVKDARDLQRKALQASELPEFALAAYGWSRDRVLNEAFRAAQFELTGPVLSAVRGAKLRSAARGAGFLYIHNWFRNAERFYEAEGDIYEKMQTASLSELKELLETYAYTSSYSKNWEGKMAAAIPDWEQLSRPEALSETDVRGRLSDNQALVMIVPPAEDMSEAPVIYTATKTGLKATRANLPMSWFNSGIAGYRENILGQRNAQMVAQLRAPVSPTTASQTQPVARPLDLSLGYSLFDALFVETGLAELLSDKTEWLIVTQGGFLSLPFAALPMSPPSPQIARDAAALRNVDWMGLRKALIMMPSVAMMQHDMSPDPSQSPRSDPVKKGYVGFGDPAFSGPPGRLRSLDLEAIVNSETRLATVSKLPRLPATHREILSTSKLFPEQKRAIRLGEDASEASFYNLSGAGALRGLSTIHFATHGLLAGEATGLDEPGLALSAPPEAYPLNVGVTNDGLLTPSEIALLDIDVDWVVLSACDTAAGGDPNSQGLTGLAQAFLLAGAKSLLVTHWAIEDDATAQLIGATIQTTQNGLSMGESLRSSMASLVADTRRDASQLPYAHPAVWAPFMIVGRNARLN